VAQAPAATDLQAEYGGIRAEAVRLAEGAGDIPGRVALLHSIFVDSHGNHAFPEVALHGALWAFGFYERRGAVSRAIAYRYFYDREERARRAYMLFEFSQGFKQANRSVFVDTYTNYFFTKRFGEEPGADEVIAPELLDALQRVHSAAARGRVLSRPERAEVFRTSLLFEQESTVGPKVREEVDKFTCPVLTAIVLRPVVRFNYFPRSAYMRFSNFGDTDERIEKAVRSYELAEDAGWDRVGDAIRYHGVLPSRFFDDPLRYADGLRAAA
jgi:hypothetical protein